MSCAEQSPVKFRFEMVVNTCPGRFDLSEAAVKEILRRKGIPTLSHWRRPTEGGKSIGDLFSRDDPDMIAVVQHMGAAASGDGSRLEVKTVEVIVWVDSKNGKEDIRGWVNTG